MKAARSDVEDVALQALEFWCTICEEESMLLSELRDVSSACASGSSPAQAGARPRPHAPFHRPRRAAKPQSVSA